MAGVDHELEVVSLHSFHSLERFQIASKTTRVEGKVKTNFEMTGFVLVLSDRE